MTRQPLLKHQHIVKLTRLLDMLYKPSEIAEEIGVATDTIYRSYLPAGLPHTRDSQGSIWIHGPAFIAWARQTIAKKKTDRIGLPDDHAWCMKCNRAVELIEPKTKQVNRYLELLQAVCPHCGKKINRARARQLPSPSGEGQGVRSGRGA
ncbi:hypothetical protein FBQ81_03165 [Chloroflexi bacterium CFX6]|nr:hypothetical protein [Chloroflexi bacterium CFX6]